VSDEQRTPSCWPENEHEWGDEYAFLPDGIGPFFPGAILFRRCVRCSISKVQATDLSMDHEWLMRCHLYFVEKAGGSVADIWLEP
jgi:hypothetical protein